MSDPTQVIFDGTTIYDAGTHTVYWRKNWADDWTEETGFQCTEAVWCCAPSIPTAALVWRYGRVKQPTANNFATVAKKLDLSRAFIKIEIQSDTATPFKWYGILEINDDHMGGARLVTDEDDVVTVSPNGQQFMTCYGMIKLLDDHDITTSVWDDSGTERTTDRGITFNNNTGRNGTSVGNRTAAKVLFGGLGTYLFEPNATLKEWWSTENIVEYLLYHQAPVAFDGSSQIPFSLAPGGVLPDWDRPQIAQENSTTFAVIDQLVNRRRMLTWWVEVTEDAGGDYCEVKTNSLLGDELPLPVSWSEPMKANTNPLHLIFDQDPRTVAVLRDSDVKVYDQVVVTGGRRRSVCTLGYTDSTLWKGWLAADALRYINGASGDADYATLDLYEKQLRDREIRDSPRLDSVYSHFTLPYSDAWDRRVRDGIGGTHDATWRHVFINLDGSEYYPFPRELRIEPVLPLKAGRYYEEDGIGSGTHDTDGFFRVSEQPLGPIVAFLRPETEGTAKERWVIAESIGSGADIESSDPTGAPTFTCSVRVDEDRKGLVITVNGADQHAIATGDYVESYSMVYVPPSGYSYADGKMIATVAIVDDRKVEARSPEEISDGDAVRRLYIDAGPDYHKDYVVPGTVVGIKDDGTLLRSDGGYLPFPGEDSDEKRLEALAVVAAAYYIDPHQILSVTTHQPTQNIELGDLIQEIGNTEAATGEGHRYEINSPVTQIKITLPDDGGPVQQRFDTWAGELDPMQLQSIFGDVSIDGETERPDHLKRPKRKLDRSAPDDTEFEPFQHVRQ